MRGVVDTSGFVRGPFCDPVAAAAVAATGSHLVIAANPDPEDPSPSAIVEALNGLDENFDNCAVNKGCPGRTDDWTNPRPAWLAAGRAPVPAPFPDRRRPEPAVDSRGRGSPLASGWAAGFPAAVPNADDALWILAAAITVAVPLRAWAVRGRSYATFALVLLLSVPAALVVHDRLRGLVPGVIVFWMDAAFLWGLAATGCHLVALTKPRLREAPFRLGISLPAMVFLSTGALSLLWLGLLAPLRMLANLAASRDLTTLLDWLDAAPAVVALASIATSSRPRRETVHFSLIDPAARPASTAALPLKRLKVRRVRHKGAHPPQSAANTSNDRILRVVQITDPHLGPWQPVRKLAREIERLCAGDPDLVLLTGDLLTMESGGTPGALTEALAPLSQLAGRCFAIFGNHDHEAIDEVRAGLRATGVRLLVDEEVCVVTRLGRIWILGADWRGRGRAEHLEQLFAEHPRQDTAPRLLLLHDPSAFTLVPPGAADLTFSGHTHGGQLGLVSLGFNRTILTGTRWPDHGLFAAGQNRLYVHRGTGHYGFPLRIGVPGEASRLEIELPPLEA